MPIPEGSNKFNELVDVVTASATHTIDVIQPDQTIEKVEVIDDEILWWKTNKVDSNKFSRFAFELKEFERMAKEAFKSMTKERAETIAQEILDIGQSYRRAIDAKSSESRRDKNNAKSTLLDTLGRNKIEKIYTAKGQLQKGFLSSLAGTKQDEDELDQ